jgi:catechol 2,3-dioxygenase-like lactoylglutathione lyase family enzyme
MPLLRIFAACLIAAVPVAAQPALQNPRNVAFGHIHLNSADPDAAIAFWKDIIGTSTYNRESQHGVSMQGALILITRNAPSGPSVGSAIDHIGLRVPDLQPFIEKLAKTPYKSFQPAGASDKLMIDGPDGVRIELTEDSTMYTLLDFDHIHFHSKQPDDTQAWYSRLFAARPGTDDQSHSSRVSGAMLTFSPADATVPSAGRAIDHIAFEIKDLESFCKKLTDAGIKLDSPYQSMPENKMSAAFLTDPSGTRIELTEGLAH